MESIMLNRECSLIFKQTSWVIQIDKGTTCNYLTENVNCFEIKIICMSIKCYFSEYLMLKIFKRKYQTPWWLNMIIWSATCSLFAKHYNYTENQIEQSSFWNKIRSPPKIVLTFKFELNKKSISPYYKNEIKVVIKDDFVFVLHR